MIRSKPIYGKETKDLALVGEKGKCKVCENRVYMKNRKIVCLSCGLLYD